MYIDGEFESTQPWLDDDFLGAASLFLLNDDFKVLKALNDKAGFLLPTTRQLLVSGEELCPDFIITDVSFRYADFDLVQTHIGDTFSHHFYGKSPIVIQVAAVLFDTVDSFGKAEFMDLYHWVYRLSRVAKTQIVPHLQFVGHIAQGAMLGCNITESSSTQDHLRVQFEFLVFNLRLIADAQNKGVSGLTINYNTAHNLLEQTRKSEKDIAALQTIDPDVSLWNFTT